MIKKSYSIQMTYEVSDAEKISAEKALLHFNQSLKLLDLASNHLNIMKTPFKEDPQITPQDVLEIRVAVRRFRDKVVENFNDFKKSAFKCVNAMQPFSSDTQTIKLIKSFIASIDDLESKANEFVDLFDDLKSPDFAANVVKSIESIQAECEDIEEIVDERIRTHIQTNILATSWIDSVSNELQMKVEKKTPLILDLYNKREEQLNKVVRERIGNDS